ncbi:MAG TPA: Hsp20/alpha crystallin family protein [bacterium]|nr:Hsp20/alpha crystallin family protein [bacterium]
MTRLQLYRHRNRSPFSDIWNLPEEVNRLFWGLSRATPEEDEAAAEWSPAVDVYEDTEALQLRAELPGLKKEDVKINVRDGVLTLRGERKFENEEKKDNFYRVERSYGSFLRSFSLPNTVDTEKIRATMKDGILELVIPKKPEAKPKEIQVEVKNS